MKKKFESVLYYVLLVLKVCCEEMRFRLFRELIVVCLNRIEFRRGVRELEELSIQRNKFFDEGDWTLE